MKTLVILSLLLLAGCATSSDHSATIEQIIAACKGEVEKVEHEVSNHRKHLRFVCRVTAAEW